MKPTAGSTSDEVLAIALRSLAPLPGDIFADIGCGSGKVSLAASPLVREVYAIDTRDGKLLARIPVGREPHGLCVYPQPGRYSLGHTGIFR
jgi:hypothetical protein